jgi:hypothetical protein
MFLYVVLCQCQREILSHWDLDSGLERGQTPIMQNNHVRVGIDVIPILYGLILAILYPQYSNVIPVQHAEDLRSTWIDMQDFRPLEGIFCTMMGLACV